MSTTVNARAFTRHGFSRNNHAVFETWCGGTRPFQPGFGEEKDQISDE